MTSFRWFDGIDGRDSVDRQNCRRTVLHCKAVSIRPCETEFDNRRLNTSERISGRPSPSEELDTYVSTIRCKQSLGCFRNKVSFVLSADSGLLESCEDSFNVAHLLSSSYGLDNPLLSVRVKYLRSACINASEHIEDAQ
ncbi:hypothetical protein CRM22_009655 [Opisthorchis felineus]|uniref:Uncharacterized protein n=1 Tax=Opisthorchis felineus TaxID=147828 RepID=A0A4S2L6H7_OPIFE|nr:hypothetical protein CRM22_009655 [Opisthorchis felineus]